MVFTPTEWKKTTFCILMIIINVILSCFTQVSSRHREISNGMSTSISCPFHSLARPCTSSKASELCIRNACAPPTVRVETDTCEPLAYTMSRSTCSKGHIDTWWLFPSCSVAFARSFYILITFAHRRWTEVRFSPLFAYLFVSWTSQKVVDEFGG